MKSGCGYGATTGALALVLLSACDTATAPEKPSVLSDDPAASVAHVDRESEELRSIAKALALSLADAPLRERVKNDMRGSRLVEHKLQFAEYLARSDRSEIRSALANNLGVTVERLQERIASIRELEFYMPVEAHRRSWRGDASLLVAFQLIEDRAPEAFTLGGTLVPLSLSVAPETPVIILVPKESHYQRAQRSQAAQFLTMAECDPDVIQCEDEGGGGGGGSTSPPGIYMEYAYHSDLHEPWTRGAPEIEVDIITPRTDTTEVDVLACAHEDIGGWRHFDQDEQVWTGRVLVADSAQLIQIQSFWPSSVPDDQKRFLIEFWEDDLHRCVLQLDNDERLLRNAALDFTLAAVSYLWGNSYLATFGVYVGLYNLFWGGVLQPDDDYLGMVVARNTWNALKPDNVTRTHAVIRGELRTGQVDLFYRPRGYFQ